MILSQTAEYALRALLHLAEMDGNDPTRVEDIATALSVPRNYLSKILHTLTRAGLLDSVRGPGGGFSLAAGSGTTTLLEVIKLFDPLDLQALCFLGRPECRDDDPCPAHGQWREIKTRVLDFVTDTTLADLAEPGRSRTQGVERRAPGPTESPLS